MTRSYRSPSRLRRLLGFLVAAWVVGAVTFGAAAPASAHAGVVAASPDPGRGLPQAPGAVVLKFSEPLNGDLSTIRIDDRGGRDVGVGETLAVEGDGSAMRRRLGLLEPGTYTVRWASVSSVDGHTLKGSYQFGIGDAPLGNEQVRSSPVASEGWLGLVGSFVAFVGLALWSGVVLLGPVARRAGVPIGRLRQLQWLAPAVALVGAAMAIVSSAIVAGAGLSGIDDVLFSSRAGYWRFVLLGASMFGTVVGLIAPRRWWILVGAACLLAAVVGSAASGHAGATTNPTLTTVSLAAHMLAVGAWIFAIVSAALSAPRVRQTLTVFSPYAVIAAVVVAATGVLNAALELNDPAELLTTSYGRVILLKAVALAAMAALGATHCRWRRAAAPRLRAMRDVVFGELGTACVALALAVALVSFPNPPREAAVAEELARPNPLGGLADNAAISVAGADGSFIVGLTILPPRPGPVEVRVQVIGVEAGDALRDAVVQATTETDEVTEIRLDSCGLGCFKGFGDLRHTGSWRFDTALVSNRGPIRTSETIALPSSDGAAVLRQATEVMEQLRSARMTEELRSTIASAPKTTDYTFQAPDAFMFAVYGGAQRIIIGRQQYTRDDATTAWSTETKPEGLAAFEWPRGYYADFWSGASAVRVLGVEDVDGVESQVIAFVVADLPAWFRLWVGIEDGRVRRMVMLTEGHLMDQHYANFDEPVTIAPP